MKYSQAQLDEAEQIVSKHLSDEIVASYTDIKNNQVVIIVPTITEDLIKQATELVHQRDIVFIAEGEVKLTDQVALR